MIAAVYPATPSESLSDGLTLAGVSVVAIEDLSVEAVGDRDVDALVVEVGDGAVRAMREVGRIQELLGMPVLVVVNQLDLVVLESSGAITEFVVSPVDPVEFRIRLHRLVRTTEPDEILVFKDLELNTLNYQAILAGGHMDLTYMEYELLRFLVENQVRVWSREQLLSKVWGYEYYGGARTVDVHVRRLRAKLGEERSSWITTVRSVGYRFG